MKQYFFLFFAAAAMVHAQPGSPFKILDYRLSAALNEKESEISGRLTALLQVKSDSVNQWSFESPKDIEIKSVSDSIDHSFHLNRSSVRPEWYHYTVDFPLYVKAPDTFSITIDFSGRVDTSASAELFINQREFLLPYSSSNSWIPYVHDTTAGRISIDMTVDTSFSVLAESSPVSISPVNNRKQWKWSDSVASLQKMVTVCGSKNIIEINRHSEDSLVSISLFIDPNRFNESFATALARQLTDAAGKFSSLCGRKNRRFAMKFVFVGNDDIYESFTKTGRLVIEKNSPKHTVFDSTIYTQSIGNPLLHHLADEFVPHTSDSNAVLSTGWAGYLATRYILSTNNNPTVEQQERLDAMINSLSFFPFPPIGDGKTAAAVGDDILSYKGRYFFLMLEYLIGKESFDSAASRMFRLSDDRVVGINDYRSLCEREYGSPLQWFFQEWLNRSTAPEYVVQWQSEITQRGIYVVTVNVEQRGELFSMPVPIVFSFGTRTVTKRIILNQYHQELSFQFNAPPSSVRLDPKYNILRWLLDIRILAHARSSRMYRFLNKDLTASEREARLALQLDPDNNTGTAPISYFSLAKISVITNDLQQAKEYLQSAMKSSAGDDALLYPLLSLVRYGNILEMEGKRDEAVTFYRRASEEGKKNPLAYAPVIIEAEKYLTEKFISTDEIWYGLY